MLQFHIPTYGYCIVLSLTKRSFSYEKLNAAILDWEKKKVAKAKSRIDRTEVYFLLPLQFDKHGMLEIRNQQSTNFELQSERRRAKALQYYRSEMERINRIAGEARGQAEESRRNEEFKVKAKANKIRSTGNIPATCLCF